MKWKLSRLSTDLYIPGTEIRVFRYLPEDPVKSTPDVSYFLFFSGPSVRDTMCNMVFFLKILRHIFFTQLGRGHRHQEFVFLKKKRGKGSKSRILKSMSRS